MRDSLSGNTFLFKFYADQAGVGHFALRPDEEMNYLSEIPPVD